ncbi:MAG: hypothetical protein RLZZ624_73 [Cyanobacteriota bacterium]
MRPLPQRAALAVLLGFPLLSPLLSPLVGGRGGAARADYAYGYSKVEQQFINQDTTGNGPGKGDSILDSTNPLELMNKLRRGAAMEEATPPKDSIDAALMELEQLSKPATASTAGVSAAPAGATASPALSPAALSPAQLSPAPLAPKPVAPLPTSLVRP